LEWVALALAPAVAVSALPTPADIISQLTHLLQFVDVFITVDTLLDGQISLDFQVQNPLPLQLQIISIDTTSGLNGTTLASFSHIFKDFVVPAFGSANSGTINNVTLTQGVIASLGFIPDGILDVNSTLSLLYAHPLFSTCATYSQPQLQSC